MGISISLCYVNLVLHLQGPAGIQPPVRDILTPSNLRPTSTPACRISPATALPHAPPVCSPPAASVSSPSPRWARKTSARISLVVSNPKVLALTANLGSTPLAFCRHGHLMSTLFAYFGYRHLRLSLSPDLSSAHCRCRTPRRELGHFL